MNKAYILLTAHHLDGVLAPLHHGTVDVHQVGPRLAVTVGLDVGMEAATNLRHVLPTYHTKTYLLVIATDIKINYPAESLSFLFVQCGHTIPALGVCAAQNNTQPQARLPTSFLGMNDLITGHWRTWLIALTRYPWVFVPTRDCQTHSQLEQEINACTAMTSDEKRLMDKPDTSMSRKHRHLHNKGIYI